MLRILIQKVWISKKETLEKILTVNNEEWLGEAAGIEEFYQKFGDKLPAELKKSIECSKTAFIELKQIPPCLYHGGIFLC